MTDLEKYQRVNSCETIEELMQCITDFAGVDGKIQGRIRMFDASNMALRAKHFYEDTIGLYPANNITREFGLRQQAMYLKHYK